EGEAYFEVRQTVGSGGQPLPFRVKTPGQLIDVLGTSFNVSAYEEDGETLTTLLEGSVRVQDAVTGGQFELVPGEQARLTNESFVKRQEDIQQVTAWKEGFFQFKKADIYTVMREIARWYNVEVRFEG